MSAPTITVLMTVYNAGRFLDAAIAGIVAQTFEDWEFVIVDDASVDGSAEVAAAWAARDKRIRLVRNATNKGQTACLNQGLAEARGQWIARQDADDLSLPKRFERQLALAAENPRLALIGSGGWIIDAENRVVGLLDVPVTPDEIAWSAPLLNPFLHTAVLAATAAVRGEGGYDESFRIAQDYDLWTRLLARHQATNLRERLVCYRHLGNSLSKSGRGTAFSEAHRISLREAATRFGRDLTPEEAGLFDSFRQGELRANRKSFWALYESLRRRHFPRARLGRIAAIHHIKAAGASGAAVPEILSALRCDPATTIGWMVERLAATFRRR